MTVRTLQGFMELLPEEQIVMNKILEQLNKLQTQTLNLQEEVLENV